MKSLKEKFQDYKKNKTVWGKITDIIFVLFIIALFIPNSRLAIVGFVNRVKSEIIEPSVKDVADSEKLSTTDFDWDLVDRKGNQVNLNEHKGKVIFLNFWATWCPPCIGEMPGIQELYDTFKDRSDVSFLLVSNESPEKVKAFIEKKKYDFPVYTSNYQAPQIFFSQSIPTTFVISKTGVIKIKEKSAVNWGGKKMTRIIEDLIKE